jgi:GH25 family lysozyme M1 (1,4-beta-N-acetylmuramidase)
MAATIIFGASRATVKGGRWKSDDEWLARLCQSATDPDGPKGYYPDFDQAVAMEVAQEIGAEVVPGPRKRHKPEDPNLVY